MLGIIGIGGRCEDTPALRSLIPKEYFAVAADSGLAHFKTLGIVPDVLVGDLDSISESLLRQSKKEHLAIERYKPEKDNTDSEIAVDKALRQGCESLLFIGAFGNRLDHMLSNQMMAASLAERGIQVVLTDGVTFMYTVTPENSPFHFPAKALKKDEDVLSIVSVSGETMIITLEGFQYPLHQDRILFGSTRTVSNTVAWEEKKRKDDIVITLEKGIALFIVTKTDALLQNRE